MKLKLGWVGIICWGLIASLAQATTQQEQLDLAETYNEQFVQYYRQGQLNKALPLAEKAFKIRTELLGEKHPNTLISLNNLAFIYQALGRLEDALPLYESGYRLFKEVLGAKHPGTLTSFNNLAFIYQVLGRLEEALPLYESGYRLSKEVLGAKHPGTLFSLNNLASIYQSIGRLEDALPLYESGYRLFKEVFGAKHPDTLFSLNNLAGIYQSMGSLEEALPLFESGYRLSKEVLGAKHPNTLTSLNNLALIYQTIGRLEDALPLYESGYRLFKEVLGAKHPDTLRSLNNLAGIYDSIGRLEEALPLYESSYRLKKEVLGAKHPDTLRSLNNLAGIYNSIGRLEEGLPLYESGYRLSKEVLGAKHPHTLISLNNLALIYQALGRLEEALPLYKSGYRLRQDVLGAKHPDTLQSLNNLASIYNSIGRLEEALPLYESGYRLKKKVLGAKHPSTLISLNNLASIYDSIGRLEEALPLYESGYRLRKEVLGAKHPTTLISLGNLGYAYAKQGQIDKAINHFERLLDGVETLRQRGDLSAENRQAWFKQWIPRYFMLSKLYLVKARLNEAFQTAEKTKARTLLESMTLKLAAQQAGLSIKEQQQLQQSQTRLAALNDRIAREADMDNKLTLKGEKTQLVIQAAKFHRSLMQKYPKYAQLNEIVTATADRSLIPADTLFISYLMQDHEVLVFTLDATGELQAKDLGEIPNLNQTLKTYREWLGKNCTPPTKKFKCDEKSVWKQADGNLIVNHEQPDHTKPVKREEFTRYLDNLSQDLAQKLLAPFKARLQRNKRLIISPDGALAQIPFETLILEEEPVIVTHQVSYVQSLSVLALLKERENEYQSIKNRGTLLAMGAAPYEGNKSDTTGGNSKVDIETMLTRSQNPQRYREAFRAKGLTWKTLPASETELENLKEIFPQACIYRGSDASEAQLLKLNDDQTLAHYQYLVFSAHGYVDMDVPALSAIVLSQVNQMEGTDGYVTASEWPSYDLKSDLMVLSACETGRGKVMRGEGVLGLPYAFYVAGNKNTLLTLWSVLDDSTAEFTKRFFTKLKEGQSQIEALTATKREFWEGEDEDLEDYKSPLFWAPFVLYGI